MIAIHPWKTNIKCNANQLWHGVKCNAHSDALDLGVLGLMCWFSFTLSLTEALLLVSSCIFLPLLPPAPRGWGCCRHSELFLWDPRKKALGCSVSCCISNSKTVDGWCYSADLQCWRRKGDSLGGTSQDQGEQRWWHNSILVDLLEVVY